MARSPFQGTWQAGVRPTVVTAPDAIVYINGSTDTLACGGCRRRFDINKYITSIQVDLSVDNAPGSANINMSIPRHTIDDFMVDGVPVISPMMEVEIYAKGFYLVEGLPQYYPIFWGLVTEISDSYSGGEHTFSINCADILKWWEYCKMNVNPSFTQPAGQLGRDYVTGNVFHGSNVYDIIWTLAQQAFGDVIHATGSLMSAIREQTQADSFNRSLSDIMNYWNARFGQIRSNLLLYGVQGTAVRGDVLYESQPNKSGVSSSNWASRAVRVANGGNNNSQLLFDPESVLPFRSNLSSSGNPNFWQSEFQTKLEIANACKEAVGFEFYMDVTGDIVFKPPFYNLDILGNKPLSWIQDIDIIDWDFSSSEAEVVTHLQMQGSFEGGAMDMGVTSDYNTPFSQIIDYHLLRKYGWRTQSFNAEYLNSTFDMFYAGVDLLDRMNARRNRATVNIPMRPELRLGFPVYVAPKDQIWYVQGISHNITMGGRAQTTLTLTAKREKFVAPKGTGSLELSGYKKNTSKEATPLVSTTKPTTRELAASGFFKLNIGDGAEVPQTNAFPENSLENPYAPLILRHPKTGRIVGYPNVVMAYTRPFQPDSQTLKRLLGRDITGKRKGKKIRDRQSVNSAEDNPESEFSQTDERRLTDKHLNNRYIYGLTSAGAYVYAHDTSAAIQELVLLQAQNIEVPSRTQSAEELLGTTAIMRPVSDERGFEVIGHFRYGRGVSLSDGSLVLSFNEFNELTGGANSGASIEAQLALSGGLFEALSAQSQGLTSVSARYPNPASAVAHLAPDGSDLQTAATINPETRKPEFSTPDSNFVDVAPLNSPKNRGVPINVEASQLSNALTLAELRPRNETTTEEECACLLGRADLAFISSGYQVEILDGTAADTSDTSTAPGGTGTEVGVSYLDQLRAQAEELRSRNNVVDDVDAQAIETQIAELENSLSENATPINPRLAAPSREQLLGTVETFLANLYDVLDTPHQEFEKEIRGNLIKTRTRDEILEGTPVQQFGDFAPPFSAPNRARGGDPRALAIQGESSLDGMAQAWKDFGDDLRRGPEQTRLQGEIERLDQKIRDLNDEERQLQAALDTGSTVVSPDGSIQDRLDGIQTERNKAVQDRDNTQAKLNILNNEDR